MYIDIYFNITSLSSKWEAKTTRPFYSYYIFLFRYLYAGPCYTSCVPNIIQNEEHMHTEILHNI